MFRKLWNGIKKNAGKIIGGLFGGILGGILGSIIDELIKDLEVQKASDLPFHLQQIVDDFAEAHVKPIVVKYLETLGAASSISSLTKEDHISNLNTAIRKLATLKAYYELKLKNTNDPDEVQINAAIIEGLGSSMQLLVDAYMKATEGEISNYNFDYISFRATDYKFIGSLPLNWPPKTSITANYFGLQKVVSGGIPPKPGGTITPGDTKPTIPTKPTKPTTGGTIRPGGTIQVPPPSKPTQPTRPTAPTLPPTTGGSTTPPADNNKPFEVINTTKEKDTKKYWIIGGAILIAAYLFNQK